jgi:hypothetical protein
VLILVGLAARFQHKIWLNDVAPLNVLSNDDTRLTSQVEIIPLKDVAFWNMPDIVMTLLVFHVEMTPLKAVAP